VASKVFTTQAGKFFEEGAWLLITSDANESNYMHGRSTAYSGTSLTVNVTNIGGSGTLADWTIRVSGTRGATGAAGTGQPGTTVVTETAFGQASAVGVDAAFYSRVDHTHGTPTNPVTAHEAAGDPHTQYMTSAEVDTSIATHAGLADPHTGYQKESEKDAASGYAGLTAGSKIQANAVETASITADAVTYAKIQNVSATDRLLGRDTAAAGDIEELTVSGGIEFTGTGIQSSAYTGDVTKAAGGVALTLANDAVITAKILNAAVTYAKIQDVSAISKLLGRGSAAGAGDVEEITLGTNLSMSGTTLNATGGAGGDSLIYEFW
jgi:hypothetical protein